MREIALSSATPAEGFIKGVRIVNALYVYSGSGIPIPVPGSTNICCGVVPLYRQAQLIPKLVYCINAGKSCTDHQDVNVRPVFFLVFHDGFPRRRSFWLASVNHEDLVDGTPGPMACLYASTLGARS